MKWHETNLTRPNAVEDELELLIRGHAVEERIPAKTVFLSPGDMLGGVYYIASGRTRHYMIGQDGVEKTLYTLSAGWFFGETPCYLEAPTGLYSKAEVETVALRIPLETYKRLTDENRLFREAILQSYSKKMLILRHEIENLCFNSCKDRLKRIYYAAADTSALVDKGWYDLKMTYTQYELSTIVGAARVTISKLIGELCSEGFIRVLNRKTQVSAAAVKQMRMETEG